MRRHQLSKLTDREIQVIGLVADGLNSRQIGEEIGLHEVRVRQVLMAIRNKTGMDTTVAAVAWCLRNRLID